jgi:hypothetical protein
LAWFNASCIDPSVAERKVLTQSWKPQ